MISGSHFGDDHLKNMGLSPDLVGVLWNCWITRQKLLDRGSLTPELEKHWNVVLEAVNQVRLGLKPREEAIAALHSRAITCFAEMRKVGLSIGLDLTLSPTEERPKERGVSSHSRNIEPKARNDVLER